MRCHVFYIVKDRTDLGKNGSLNKGSPMKDIQRDSDEELNHSFSPPMWRKWSIQHADLQDIEFEGILFNGSNIVYRL